MEKSIDKINEMAASFNEAKEEELMQECICGLMDFTDVTKEEARESCERTKHEWLPKITDECYPPIKSGKKQITVAEFMEMGGSKDEVKDFLDQPDHLITVGTMEWLTN